MAGHTARCLLLTCESRLRARFGDDILAVEEQHGHAVATVARGRYHEVCRFLRDEPEFACDYCDFTGGVDFGAEDGFEVVTHLFSTHAPPQRARQGAAAARGPALPDDLRPVRRPANWHERETIEMFGDPRSRGTRSR